MSSQETTSDYLQKNTPTQGTFSSPGAFFFSKREGKKAAPIQIDKGRAVDTLIENAKRTDLTRKVGVEISHDGKSVATKGDFSPNEPEQTMVFVKEIEKRKVLSKEFKDLSDEVQKLLSNSNTTPEFAQILLALRDFIDKKLNEKVPFTEIAKPLADYASFIEEVKVALREKDEKRVQEIIASRTGQEATEEKIEEYKINNIEPDTIKEKRKNDWGIKIGKDWIPLTKKAFNQWEKIQKILSSEYLGFVNNHKEKKEELQHLVTLKNEILSILNAQHDQDFTEARNKADELSKEILKTRATFLQEASQKMSVNLGSSENKIDSKQGSTEQITDVERQKLMDTIKEINRKIYFSTTKHSSAETFAVANGFIMKEDGSNEKFERVDGNIGIVFDAHGIAKLDQLGSLLNLLSNGIDPTRRFFSAPFEVNLEDKRLMGPAFGTSDGTAYKEGIAVITSGPNQSLLKDGIRHVFINDVYGDLVEPLSKLYPQYNFHLLSEQKKALEADFNAHNKQETSLEKDFYKVSDVEGESPENRERRTLLQNQQVRLETKNGDLRKTLVDMYQKMYDDNRDRFIQIYAHKKWDSGSALQEEAVRSILDKDTTLPFKSLTERKLSIEKSLQDLLKQHEEIENKFAGGIISPEADKILYDIKSAADRFKKELLSLQAEERGEAVKGNTEEELRASAQAVFAQQLKDGKVSFVEGVNRKKILWDHSREKPISKLNKMRGFFGGRLIPSKKKEGEVPQEPLPKETKKEPVLEKEDSSEKKRAEVVAKLQEMLNGGKKKVGDILRPFLFKKGLQQATNNKKEAIIIPKSSAPKTLGDLTNTWKENLPEDKLQFLPYVSGDTAMSFKNFIKDCTGLEFLENNPAGNVDFNITVEHLLSYEGAIKNLEPSERTKLCKAFSAFKYFLAEMGKDASFDESKTLEDIFNLTKTEIENH